MFGVGLLQGALGQEEDQARQAEDGEGGEGCGRAQDGDGGEAGQQGGAGPPDLADTEGGRVEGGVGAGQADGQVVGAEEPAQELAECRRRRTEDVAEGLDGQQTGPSGGDPRVGPVRSQALGEGCPGEPARRGENQRRSHPQNQAAGHQRSHRTPPCTRPPTGRRKTRSSDGRRSSRPAHTQQAAIAVMPKTTRTWPRKVE